MTNHCLQFLLDKPEVANAIAALGSTALGLFALVISVVSVYFARSSLKHQEEHNRLSVRPLCYVTLGDYEHRLFVKLRNNGTGPLLLESVRIKGAEDEMAPLIRAMPDLPPNCDWVDFVEDIEGRSISPGDELMLLELSAENCDPTEAFPQPRDLIRKQLGKLEVHVHYTDIYGSSLPEAVRSLIWFHRNLDPQYVLDSHSSMYDQFPRSGAS